MRRVGVTNSRADGGGGGGNGGVCGIGSGFEGAEVECVALGIRGGIFCDEMTPGRSI